MRKFISDLFHSVHDNNKLYEAFMSLSNGGGLSSHTQKSLMSKNPFLVLISFIIIEITIRLFFVDSLLPSVGVIANVTADHSRGALR